MAVTGGIAEGKSTVLRMLAEDGFLVASSDEAARSLLSTSRVRSRVAQLAGLAEEFENHELRTAMLDSKQVRRAVNNYLHPLIGEINARANATFFEVPLLIEACLHEGYDQVWVVTCGPDEQRKRLIERVGEIALADRILAVQLSTDTKCCFSDMVIRTNEPLEAVREALRECVRAAKLD